MTDELKACPLCNSQGIYAGTGMGEKFYKCSNGHCVLSEYKIPYMAWQRRPIEDALEAEIQNHLNVISDDEALLAEKAREIESWKRDELLNKEHVDSLQEENKRLRGALDLLYGVILDVENYDPVPGYRVDEAINAARKALGAKE